MCMDATAMAMPFVKVALPLVIVALPRGVRVRFRSLSVCVHIIRFGAVSLAVRKDFANDQPANNAKRHVFAVGLCHRCRE